MLCRGGAACSMASAMAVYFMGGSMEEIEYAAEDWNGTSDLGMIL